MASGKTRRGVWVTLLTSVMLSGVAAVSCESSKAPGGAEGETVNSVTRGWRGDGTGRYPEAAVCLEWGENKNIRWKTALPEWSNSSPILVKDRIFVCAEPTTLICLDAKDGKILWQRTNHYFDTLSPEEVVKAKALIKQAEALKAEVKRLEAEFAAVIEKLAQDTRNAELTEQFKQCKERIAAANQEIEDLGAYHPPSPHPTAGYSTATATSDGEYVYMLFGTATVACYDMEGERRWIKWMEVPMSEQWASPLLIGDKLIVHVIDVYALDAATGETLWKVEAEESRGSPVRARIGDTEVVVTINGDIIRVADGTIVARKTAQLKYCAPIVNDDVAYFIKSGGKAIRLVKDADGGERAEVLWETKPKDDRYYASPVYHDGLIYAITQAAVLSVIDAVNGQVVYEKELELGEGTVYPSLTIGGGHLLVSSDNGTTLVLTPGRQYHQVAKNQIEGFRTSPLMVGDSLYIRALKHLYCIGPSPDKP